MNVQDPADSDQFLCEKLLTSNKPLQGRGLLKVVGRKRKSVFFFFSCALHLQQDDSAGTFF